MCAVCAFRQRGELMKIVAVIAEYNPFHNGHAYMLCEIKKQLCDAAVVVIMSGDFTQRGEAAIIGKYARAESAVKCGADLVLELPTPWCFSGAEFFAKGGVSIAAAIGADVLAFGAECGDISALTLAAKRLSSEEFCTKLSNERAIQTAANMAKLRADVYEKLYGDAALFCGSNNLLAMEYLRALESLRLAGKLTQPMTPLAIKRIGGAFGSTELSAFSSATAIRTALRKNDDVLAFLPPPSAEIIVREIEGKRFYDMVRLDIAVITMLRTISPERLAQAMEISGGMEHRLIRAAKYARTVDEILTACEERRYSRSRLRRAILSALLDVTMPMAEEFPHFTPLLAANARGREVLGSLRKDANISILSRTSQIRTLENVAARQFALHARAMSVAELACEGIPKERKPYLCE